MKGFVGFGENKDKWDLISDEPFNEFKIDRLRGQSRVKKSKNTAQVGAVDQVIGDGFVKLGAVLLGGLGKSVSWQVNETPGVVHREGVDELGEPGGWRNAGEIALSRKHVDQRGLSNVGASDEREFGQGLVWTGIQVRRAAIKNGG